MAHRLKLLRLFSIDIFVGSFWFLCAGLIGWTLGRDIFPLHGAWNLLIGLFLHGAAIAGRREVLTHMLLTGVPVAAAMNGGTHLGSARSIHRDAGE